MNPLAKESSLYFIKFVHTFSGSPIAVARPYLLR
jgi:hypothetical protein